MPVSSPNPQRRLPLPRFSRRGVGGGVLNTGPRVLISTPSINEEFPDETVTPSGSYTKAPAGSTLELTISDSTPTVIATESIPISAGDGLWTATLVNLTSGQDTYTITVNMEDSGSTVRATAGPNTFSVPVPEVAITAPAGTPTTGVNNYQPEGTFGGAPTGSTVLVTLKDAGDSTVDTDSVSVGPGTGAWQAKSFTSLTDQTYTFEAILRDSGLSTIATATDQDLTVALPALTITTPSGTPTITVDNYQPAGGYSNAPTGADIFVTVEDSGASVVASEVLNISSGNGTWQMTSGVVDNLTDDTYTVTAIMRDSGDSTIATVANQDFTVLLPALTITYPTADPELGVDTIEPTGTHTSAPAGSTVEVVVKDATTATVGTDSIPVSGTGTWAVGAGDITGLVDGEYTVEATLEDSGSTVLDSAGPNTFSVLLAGHPATLAGSLHYWVASEGVTTNGSNEVTEWQDQISDNHFSDDDGYGGTITSLPTLTATDSEFNNEPVLDFGKFSLSEQGRLRLTRIFDHSADSTGVEVHFIMRWELDTGLSGGDAGLHTFHSTLSPAKTVAAPWTNGFTYDRGSTDVQLGVAHKQDEAQCYSFVSRDGLIDLRKDGTSLISSTTSVSYDFSTITPEGNVFTDSYIGCIGVGYNAGIARNLEGRVAAIYVHDGEMSAGDRFDLHSYWNDTFGLSLPTS